MVIQVCIVCITIAVVWIIALVTPTIIQIKRTAKEIEVTTKSIYRLSESTKEGILQINKTLESLSNCVKGDVEKMDNVVNKIKGITDIIVNSVTPPLIKIISVATGIGSGLLFLFRRGKS